MSALNRHFILFRDIPLIYGIIPKAANSSIKSSLCDLLKRDAIGDVKTTADRFWRRHTYGETKLITAKQARRLRNTHYSFSFVRNPFDRIVAAYNNKILEIDTVPEPMRKIGLYHHMPFDEFLQLICEANPEKLDNHVRPQSEILLADGKLVPNFVGRIEHMHHHWRRLRLCMEKENLPTLGDLQQKNVRRTERNDIRYYFKSKTLINLAAERYSMDFKLFYSEYSRKALLSGKALKKKPPLIKKRKKQLSSTLLSK